MPTVLIVDDKEDNLYLLRALLTGNGFDALTATNGQQALELARDKAPDLVISDILMPVMDGFTLCRIWKNDPKLSRAPFVFYTATYTDPKDEQLAMSIGADRFLIKPLEPDLFLAQIRQVLDDYRHQSVPARAVVQEPDAQYLREYNAVLVHKLERKVMQLEDANRKLAENDAFTRAALDAMTAPLAVIGERGEVLMANRAWVQAGSHPDDPELLQLRVGDDALTKLAYDQPQHAGAMQRVRQGLRDVMENRRPQVRVEVVYEHGGPSWLMIQIERVGFAGSSAIITCVDVTALKLAEQTLVDDSRRKDQLLALLAHELRNPLAPLRAASQVLQATASDDRMLQRASAIIDRQVGHLTHIVDDLLDMENIARQHLKVKKEPIDLAEVLRKCIADHLSWFEDRDISLQVDIATEPVWVRGDATRLTQVIANVLDNARRFTDPGGRVEVQLSPDATHHAAVLVVRDNGIGITAETLARIFEPFEQAQQSAAHSRGGFGLGLAIVKGLVDLHGGEVHAASAGPGRGSEVTVLLPLIGERPLPVHAPAPPTQAVGSRVLVIEDNHDAADALQDLLQTAGCVVRVAYDGKSGLALAQAAPPEIIFCDVGLPDMDGYSLAKTVRADPRLGKVRLVALTGYGQAEDRRRAQDAGFDAHVTKPADAERLLQLVGAAHEQKGTDASA